MKIQKQVSDKRGKKIYYKYVVVLPEKLVEKAGFKVKQELEGESSKGKIVLKKR